MLSAEGWCALHLLHAQTHAQLKISVYDVETLVQLSKALHAEDKVATEIATLREAFARLQNTKKVCAVCRAMSHASTACSMGSSRAACFDAG